MTELAILEREPIPCPECGTDRCELCHECACNKEELEDDSV